MTSFERKVELIVKLAGKHRSQPFSDDEIEVEREVAKNILIQLGVKP